MLILILTVAAAACSPAAIIRPGGTGPLRVGALPTIELLPLLAAEQDGHFTLNNVSVTIVVFASAAERDQALASGDVDAAINDVVSASLINREADRVRVLQVVYAPTAEQALVSIVARPAITSPIGLGQARLATAEASLVAYGADRLLDARGIRSPDVPKVAIGPALQRAEALANGQADAVALVEPFTAVAVARGGRVLLEDRGTRITQSVLSVRRDVLRNKYTSVRRFLVGLARGAEVVGANPARYRHLLFARAGVPDPGAAFKMPRFPAARLPSEDNVRGVGRWLVSVGLLETPLPYHQLVDPSYAPK